ncbi:MAG: hypothetical protein WCV50_06365 [Patescibacteria group bacterium]
MYPLNQPYLIIPKFIEQPTWGGSFIAQLKGWDNRPEFKSKKIGQSYELSGQSFLAIDCTDSADERFGPEGSAISIKKVSISDLITQNPEAVLGEGRTNLSLLIKFTQALGNSFQLHVPPGIQHPHWQPKPESWYFLEPGLATLGLQPNIDVARYHAVCNKIDQAMQQLSGQVLDKLITIEQARKKAHELVRQENPWQFVNIVPIPKHSLVDLSAGGLHHSWEDNSDASPLGNVVFEIQADKMDEASTIRCFDQGKIKDDGTIRPLQINDYFDFLDTDPTRNVPESFFSKPRGKQLLSTKHYSLDIIEITKIKHLMLNGSFHHLFVRDGAVEVVCPGGRLRLSQGHSCLVPASIAGYSLQANKPSVVLKTYLN